MRTTARALRLTLFFAIIGLLTLGSIALNNKKDQLSGPTLHLAGDSTLSVKLASRRPETGWGEPFAEMMCENVRVINHAMNGRSTKSFITEGRWQKLLNKVKKGDFVFIQFGHNDQKRQNLSLFTSPWRQYRNNIERFVHDVKMQGAVPVLLTPIVRRSFNNSGQLINSLEDYPEVVRVIAREHDLMLIDLNKLTHLLVEAAGIEQSKDYYLHLKPNEHPNYRSGKVDNSHLSPTGAIAVAGLAAEELSLKYPELVCYSQAN